MIDGVPEESRDLLLDETRAFAHLATEMADGSPQVTPVWFDVGRRMIRVNTAEGRVKCRNMKQRAGVALAIADPKDPYRYLQIRGRVDAGRTRGARRISTGWQTSTWGDKRTTSGRRATR